MLKETKELITAITYSQDIGKSVQAVRRYINAGRKLPGIKEYYNLGPNMYVLKKGNDYDTVTKSIANKKRISQE